MSNLKLAKGKLMKKQTKLKYIWIVLNFLLLAVPVFVPSLSINVIAICVSLMIILSFPLNLLVGWLFFYTNLFDGSIGSMYLMLFFFSVLAYIQWFVIVPRFVRFTREKFFSKDLNVNFTAEQIIALPEAKTEFTANDHRKNWYDEQKRTPVERILENNDE